LSNGKIRTRRKKKLSVDEGSGGSTRFMVAYYSFPFFPIIKMYSLLSIILSFSSVFLLITADDALNILMPDVIANHVGVFLMRDYVI
jgi:hypothetical protein